MDENATDWGTRIQEWLDSFVESAPSLMAAVAILIIGWIVAIVAAAAVRKLLSRTQIDDKLGDFLSGEGKQPWPLDRWIATAVKWLILLFTLVLVVDKLGMHEATKPLNALLAKITGYLPQILGATVLMFIGWVVARIARFAVEKALGAAGADRRLAEATGDEPADAPAAPAQASVTKSVGAGTYWLILLLFLVMAIERLELDGLVEPLQSMLTKLLAFLPNVLAAVVIGVIGWFLATVVRRVLTSILVAVGVDGFADRVGLSKVGKGTLSSLLGTVAYVLILLNVLAAALGALQLDAVSRPISGLLETLYASIPNLLYAAVIVLVAVFLGRVLATLVSDLLARLGFDRVFAAIGLSKADFESVDENKRPSAVVGQLVLIAVLFFAGMEALDLLGLDKISGLMDEFILLAGKWALGLLIFGLGLWLAKFVSDLLKQRETPLADMLATAARIGITVLAGIAALTRMEVAEDVVQWSAILVVGAIGLGAALAFGLGCQDQAGEQMREWRGEIDRKRLGDGSDSGKGGGSGNRGDSGTGGDSGNGSDFGDGIDSTDA